MSKSEGMIEVVGAKIRV